MAEHRFKIGQSVYSRPKKLRLAVHTPLGRYQVTERFSATSGEF
jgi:hypothetical protein